MQLSAIGSSCPRARLEPSPIPPHTDVLDMADASASASEWTLSVTSACLSPPPPPPPCQFADCTVQNCTMRRFPSRSGQTGTKPSPRSLRLVDRSAATIDVLHGQSGSHGPDVRSQRLAVSHSPREATAWPLCSPVGSWSSYASCVHLRYPMIPCVRQPSAARY